MYILELLVTFKRCSSLLGAHCTNCILELAKGAVFSQLDLTVAIACVIQNSVDAGNDATRVVKSARLLHVIVICYGRVSTLAIFLLFEELGVDDNGKARLRHKAKQILIESVDFTEGPRLRQACRSHIIAKYLWVALKGWPVERLLLLLLFDHSLKVRLFISG